MMMILMVMLMVPELGDGGRDAGGVAAGCGDEYIDDSWWWWWWWWWWVEEYLTRWSRSMLSTPHNHCP